jgi:AraC-like DNA-binding protein
MPYSLKPFNAAHSIKPLFVRLDLKWTFVLPFCAMDRNCNSADKTGTPIGLTAISRAPLSGPNNTLGAVEVHQHAEVELIIYEHGSVTMLLGGRKTRIPPRQLAVFWGAMPHHALDADPKAMASLLRIPMPLVMQWKLPAWLMQQLFDFQVLVDATNQTPCADLDLLKHWIRLMAKPSIEAERIVMLEAEARLRRMALDRDASAVLVPRATGAGRLERMVETIARRCLGRVRIPEVAREAGLTRAYAMRLFRKNIGMTMLEYITRQRVSHAQRLLATTDRGVLDIMGECGFQSPTRFYAVFRRFVGGTPAQYRRRFFPARPAGR